RPIRNRRRRMAEAKKLGGAGLRGQTAGETALCTVGKEGTGLTYRGYDMKELAEKVSFEEVAYLLLKGELPNRKQLDEYRARLKSLRSLPAALKEGLERIPRGARALGVMRTGWGCHGNFEPEKSFDERQDVAYRLLTIFPTMITDWYRLSHDCVRIYENTDDDSIGAHF